MENNKVYAKGFKGFNLDFSCRGKRYSENTIFEDPDAKICECGMHFCKDPWDVFSYYPMINNNGSFNVYSTVEALDEVIENDVDDSKCCTKKLRVGKRMSFSDFIDVCIGYTLEAVTTGSGNDANIGSSGDFAKIGSSGLNAKIGSSGDFAKIGSSGFSAKIGSSGNCAKIGSSGDYARIGSSGNRAQIGSSGDYAQIGSSGYEARIGSSGECARIGSSGDDAKIGSSGDRSVICCAGHGSIAKAGVGSWITLSEWIYSEEINSYIPKCVKAEYVDGKRIKADTFYKLENGEFVEVKAN